MTQAELNYLERMPRLLHDLVNEISNLNKQVKVLTEKVEQLNSNDKK